MEVSAILMSAIVGIGAASAAAVVARPTLVRFVYAPSARYAVPMTVSAERLFVSMMVSSGCAAVFCPLMRMPGWPMAWAQR
jgi:hypothetical protein